MQFLILLIAFQHTMSAIASTIVAHKFLIAIALASLTVTGGTIAVESSANTAGTMSFTVNSSINVVSIANMNFGNLSSSQSKTFTTTAKIDITSGGNYTLFLENMKILDYAFSSFNVNVTGLGSNAIMLSLYHPWAEFNTSSGVHTVTVNVDLTVNNEIGNTLNVSNSPFLGISTYPPYHIEPMPSVTFGRGDDNEQGNDGN